jgi:hypothetical protein
MSNKPAPNETLRDRLARFRQINITVTGRKSGRAISNPVWFVLDEDRLYLLPVQGSDTQWYTCSRTPRFGSMHAAHRVSFRLFPSLIPRESRL